MKSPASTRLRLVVTALLCGLALPAMAGSLVPPFGNEGAEFTTKAANGNTVNGWLPTEWTDNTEWAPVTATYTKLTDSPDKAVGAVRIKTVKVEEGGQLQLTTYGGNQKYKKGVKYQVSGWVRSPERTSVKIGVRQMQDPYEFYNEQDQSTETDWKRFDFSFTPSMDFTAFLMFVMRDQGTVDLAGITVEEKP